MASVNRGSITKSGVQAAVLVVAAACAYAAAAACRRRLTQGLPQH